MLALRLGALAFALLLPGCLEDSELPHDGGSGGSEAASMAGAYQDADVRARNTIAGEDTTKKTINIPPGASAITVKAWYAVAGEGDFVLKNPAGLVAREDHPEGSKSVHDDDWYAQANPAPGPWTLTLTVRGSGDYTFGVYF